MKILIIGGGNMGQTYAQSFLRSHITDRSNMMILERSPEKAAAIATKEIGTICNHPGDCISGADLIIFAVKPQDCPELFKSIRPYVNSEQVFLSIMAGVKIETICENLNVTKVIRAMPNLPAQVGMGMTAFTSSDEVTRLELVMVQNLINTTGKSIYVEKESSIDAATDLYSKNNFTCQEWIDKVASKGGTTEAAIASFVANKVEEDIIAGADAAHDRAIELGKVTLEAKT